MHPRPVRALRSRVRPDSLPRQRPRGRHSLAGAGPVTSYYRPVKPVAADQELDTKRARKKPRRSVEEHDHAILFKGKIVVDHFPAEKWAARRIQLPDEAVEI